MLVRRYPNLWRGCVGAWCPSVDNSRSTILTDKSGYGNHGTLTNMDPATDWVASGGKVALDFDGTNDYVDCGLANNAQIPIGDMSVSLWLTLPTLGTFAFPASHGENNRGWFFQIGTNGLQFKRGNTYLYSTMSVFANMRMVTYRQVSSTGELWLDVNLIASGTMDSSVTYIGKMNFGTLDGVGLFALMKLGECRLYNRAITPSEIATLAMRRGIAYETRRIVSARGALNYSGNNMLMGVS